MIIYEAIRKIWEMINFNSTKMLQNRTSESNKEDKYTMHTECNKNNFRFYLKYH